VLEHDVFGVAFVDIHVFFIRAILD
jgi:hypothetical protein